MKPNKLVCDFGTALILILQISCSSVRSSEPASQIIKQQPINAQWEEKKKQTSDKKQISKEEAITIANEDAEKSYPSFYTFKVVACDYENMWLVIYDGGGPEYFIDNESGTILWVQKVPQGPDEVGIIAKSESSDESISEEDAIDVAKKDFHESNGEENLFDPVSCELTHSWRVFFKFKVTPDQSTTALPNTDPPNYVIDKKSGKIIYKQKY
jgi:Zn-dependent metalloprotease